jgi:MHS family alpha-ketoglutarate permease-like MFS transporter
VADEKHRGFYSSFQYVTLIGGQLCAIVVLFLLQQVFLTPAQLRAWGWRIPFLVGAVLALTALAMRRNLHETEDFTATQSSAAKQPPSLRALMQYPREVLLVVGLTMGGTTAFYTYTTYMQKFLKLSVGLTDMQTTLVTGASLVVALILQPTYGAISDRVGRKPLLIWFGVMGTLLTIPLLHALQVTKSGMTAFLLICGAWLIVAGYTSINAVVKAELFPTHIRALGVGLPYAVAVSIFGGTAESIALWFKSIGHEGWFYYYLTTVIAVSLLVYIGMRDTKRHSAIRRGQISGAS